MNDDQNKNQGQEGDVAEPVASPLDLVSKERDEYLNGWRRAKADLINYKKEEDRRFKEIAEFATLGMVRELLAGMDSFDLALSATKDEAMKNGIMMIKNQFDEILKRQGVTRIAVVAGAPPDPRLHEAINEVELSADQKGMEGMIIKELVAGYQMGERVIRAAKVSVGRSAM
jgi:molecular chaperone GrpE